MRKINGNIYKQSRIEKIFIFIIGFGLVCIGLLFVIVGLAILFLQTISFYFKFILLVGSISGIIGYLYLFNYPYLIKINDESLECWCVLKKWYVRWEDVMEIKELFHTHILVFLTFSPLTLIVKIKNKNIFDRYLLLPYAWDKRDDKICFLFNFIYNPLVDSGEANREIVEGIRKKIMSQNCSLKN